MGKDAYLRDFCIISQTVPKMGSIAVMVIKGRAQTESFKKILKMEWKKIWKKEAEEDKGLSNRNISK